MVELELMDFGLWSFARVGLGEVHCCWDGVLRRKNSTLDCGAL
jgi:hypothetical protein